MLSRKSFIVGRSSNGQGLQTFNLDNAGSIPVCPTFSDSSDPAAYGYGSLDSGNYKPYQSLIHSNRD